MRATVLVLACTGGTLLPASPASAEPFTRERTQLAAALAYGVYAGEAADVIPSPYGVGLGARAGYTLGPRIYAGAEVNYFFGASRSFPEYGDVEGSLKILHYGLVAGYDIRVAPWCVVRPALGVGAARVTAIVRVEGLSGDVSQTGFVATAGAEALFGWQPAYFGIEARYTSFYVDTAPLEDIPGLELDESARLDGFLFAAKGGVYF
ncbi:MAG TPA: outer membrane beta-barrel protein [Polyangiaceae bacterium]|nr:outer membrane beta-barrel protein [Polyangiaceae bacterium]